MMKSLIPFLVLTLVAGGCRKKPSVTTGATDAAPASAEVAAPAAAQTQTSGPSAPAPTSRVVTEADVATYNLNLAAWINSRDEVPKTLEDLKKLNGLPFLPNPPPGRRYVYAPNFDRPVWSKIRME